MSAKKYAIHKEEKKSSTLLSNSSLTITAQEVGCQFEPTQGHVS